MRVLPLDNVYEVHLREALYQAVYNPGEKPLDRTIIEEPALVKYHEAWGRALDFGFVAVLEPGSQVVGVCWCRLFQNDDSGFGFVDESTPELSIAVWESHRGSGIGGLLLERTIAEARVLGCAGLSLSVNKRNRCVDLYRRNGFEVARSDGDACVMYLPLL